MWLLALACTGNDPGWSGGGQSSNTPPLGTTGDEDSGQEGDSADTGPEVDPNLDTDGDGHPDVDELAAGSDPEVCWSVPEGSWPDCRAKAQADGLEEGGWRIGKTMPNWTATDQYGNEIEAWQLYGMVVVLDISAGWCGPCNQAAQNAEDWYQDKKDEGVIEVHLMIDDWYGNGVSQQFLEEWAEEYGLTFPVVMEPTNTVYGSYYDEGYVEGIPTYFIFDRELVLKETWSGYAGEQYLSMAVARYK